MSCHISYDVLGCETTYLTSSFTHDFLFWDEECHILTFVDRAIISLSPAAKPPFGPLSRSTALDLDVANSAQMSSTTTSGQCLCGKVHVSSPPLLSSTPQPFSHPLLTRLESHLQVTVTGRPLASFPTLTCHCVSCKRRSGGVASYAFVVPKQNVRFHPQPNPPNPIGPSGGPHKIYVDKDTGSGHPMQRTMCAECGSPVCIIESADPDARCLQFGLFADSEGVDLSECKPALEMFASRRVEWIPELGDDVRDKA